MRAAGDVEMILLFLELVMKQTFRLEIADCPRRSSPEIAAPRQLRDRRMRERGL